jgi:hypothetical protein
MKEVNRGFGFRCYMRNTEYDIDGEKHIVSIEGSPIFKMGKDEILSRIDTDITYGQPWYDKGYTEVDFLSTVDFKMLKQGLTSSIEKIIKKELSINTEGFDLTQYHKYVKNDSDHFKVVSKTRDLFANDFNFPVGELIPRLGEILGIQLTDFNSKIQKKLHIIVRINRPNSKDYNPPHKDIYEGVDNVSYIPKFMNFWIPVVGVTENSSLPLVPYSHKLNEKVICRTFEGSLMGGNRYRVRMIKSWGNDKILVRSSVKDGQVLMFSSHLIHGLAINNEFDSTRVALEFRLFKVDE